MKRMLCLLACFVFMTVSAHAYFGIDAGGSMYTLDYGGYYEVEPTNGTLGVSFGGLFNYGLRLEGQLTYTLESEADVNMGYGDVSYAYRNYMTAFNFYYDFKLSDSVSVYPTLGLGLVLHKVSAEDINWDDTIFAGVVQIGAGVRFMLSDGSSIDVNIRYINAGGYDYEYYYNGYLVDSYSVDIDAINLQVGLKFW
jgi:opacity protein-like surface antigen